MITGKILICTFAGRRVARSVQPRLLSRNRDLCRVNHQAIGLIARSVSSHHVTKNIEFLSQDNGASSSGSTAEIMCGGNNRPLLVILSWLLSKRKHIMKFANLYMEQGFDIAMVTITPWQLMWPVKGSRLVAADILKFLMQNDNYQHVLVHGFSVGGYMWGEVLDLIERDRQKYDPLIKRIVGQVWDSVADVTELTIGTPRAVFPKNLVLQGMMKAYLEYHMKAFYKQSTQYYIRSSQIFHASPIRCPALLFISKTDPVGTLTSNLRLRDQWESLGIKTYVKVFDQSPHVGHYRHYPKEYVAELYAFLSKLNLIQNEEKIRAHL